MIDQNQINQIAQFLNLEKINVIQKIELLCFPKVNNDEFKIKVENVKKELKKIPNVDLHIVEEGDIDVKLIEFSSES